MRPLILESERFGCPKPMTSPPPLCPLQKQVMPAMAERRGWPAAVALQGSGS